MPEQLTFRLVTGEQVTRDVSLYGADEPARNFLLARDVRFDDGLELRQHRPVGGQQRREGYERLDNEILAGRQLHELADWSYPAQVAKLYGDEANSADPFALFEPYRGRPLRDAGPYLGDEEFDVFLTGLLTGLCWIAAAGLAHRMISQDTVLWDPGRGVLITDFSRSTIFGVPRSELKGYDGWVPSELRSGSCTGIVGPRDDIWAAGRLIFFVRNQGEELRNRSQFADVDAMFRGMFNRVFGPVEERPTARELLEDGLGQRVNIPSATRRSDRLTAGRANFLDVRERKHPGTAVPPDFNADLDWMGGHASNRATPVNGGRQAAWQTTVDHTTVDHTAVDHTAVRSSAYLPERADDDMDQAVQAGDSPAGGARFKRRRGGS